MYDLDPKHPAYENLKNKPFDLKRLSQKISEILGIL
jgi:hypothetical protein